MKRFGLMAAPLLVVMIAVMGVSGNSDRFAVDGDAPWAVAEAERFLPPELGRIPIRSVSPMGTWMHGLDEWQPGQPECFWHTSTWEQTCPDLEPGETIGFTNFAWSLDETAFVAPTYMPDELLGGMARLVRIDPASGEVVTVLRLEPGTSIHQVALSPDGNHVAFLERPDGPPSAIRRIDRDGSGLETILKASDEVTLSAAADLRWTATDHIVFFSGPWASDARGYFRVNSDGSGLERITAVTPAELETSIRDISADGRYMIVEGMDQTEDCGPDYVMASAYVVDLERDEIAQVICAVYEPDMPGGRGTSLFATARSVVASEPAFLPDGAILVIVEQRAGGDSTTSLAVIDVDTGRISIVSDGLPDGVGLLREVTSGRDDGTVQVWAGGYWTYRITMTPVA